MSSIVMVFFTASILIKSLTSQQKDEAVDLSQGDCWTYHVLYLIEIVGFTESWDDCLKSWLCGFLCGNIFQICSKVLYVIWDIIWRELSDFSDIHHLWILESKVRLQFQENKALPKEHDQDSIKWKYCVDCTDWSWLPKGNYFTMETGS